MYFINNLEQICYIKKLKYKINKIQNNRVKEYMAAETKQSKILKWEQNTKQTKNILYYTIMK